MAITWVKRHAEFGSIRGQTLFLKPELALVHSPGSLAGTPTRRSLVHASRSLTIESLAMARYYFNIADGIEQPDPVGTELDSLQQVRHEALRFSGEVLREMGDEFWDDTEWKLTVTDNAGAQVLTLKFSAETG